MLAVLLYHADVSWAQGGYLGVDAFFVLSGFLITRLLLAERQRQGRIDLRAFWTRRARRLLPAIALVLAAVAAYAAFVASPVEAEPLRRDGLAAISYLANWEQVFSDASYFEQYGAPSPLRHMWSLAIEEQFYLVWPIVVAALLARTQGSRRAVAGACIGIAVASAAWMAWLYQPGDDPSRVYYGTDTRAQSLVIGALLAALLAGAPAAPTTGRHHIRQAGGLLAAAALGWIWLTTTDREPWQYRGGFALAAMLVAFVIASVARPDHPGPLGRALSAAPVRWIGLISYGLYLWHWPLYVYLSPDRTGLDGAALLGVRLGATFVIATLSYLVVEQPIRHGALPGWRIRVLAPATAAALVAALVLATTATVPHELREVQVADLAPPPDPPAPDAPARAPGAGLADRDVAAELVEEPLRVMLVGDSVARSLGPGIERAAAAHGFVFWDVSVPGCGLATDIGERWFAQWQGVEEKCVPPWRARYHEHLAQFRPDIVVGLFGAQDAFDRRIDGNPIPFDSPAGDELARRDLQEAADVLTAGDTRLVLLTAPYYRLCCPMKIEEARSPMNEDWIDRYNAVQAAVARDNAPSVALLDLNRTLDPDGTWTDTVQGVKVRSDDRAHLSAEGADFSAAWLVPHLLRLGGAPASDAPPEDARALLAVAGNVLAQVPYVLQRG